MIDILRIPDDFKIICVSDATDAIFNTLMGITLV